MKKYIRRNVIIICNLFLIFALLLFNGCGGVDPEIEKKIDRKEVELEKHKKKLNMIEDNYEELDEANRDKREDIAENYSRILTSKLQLKKISSNKKYPGDIKTLVKVLGKIPDDPVYFSNIVIIKGKHGDSEGKGGWIYDPENGVFEPNL